MKREEAQGWQQHRLASDTSCPAASPNLLSPKAAAANFAFRLAEPAFQLPLKLDRHEAVKLLPARVHNITLSSVISDAGVAVLAAYAALRSAALNVFTNARMITDKVFAEAKLKELHGLLAGAESATEKAYGVVKDKLS